MINTKDIYFAFIFTERRNVFCTKIYEFLCLFYIVASCGLGFFISDIPYLSW